MLIVCMIDDRDTRFVIFHFASNKKLQHFAALQNKRFHKRGERLKTMLLRNTHSVYVGGDFSIECVQYGMGIIRNELLNYYDCSDFCTTNQLD